MAKTWLDEGNYNNRWGRTRISGEGDDIRFIDTPEDDKPHSSLQLDMKIKFKRDLTKVFGVFSFTSVVGLDD